MLLEQLRDGSGQRRVVFLIDLADRICEGNGKQHRQSVEAYNTDDLWLAAQLTHAAESGGIGAASKRHAVGIIVGDAYGDVAFWL